jgi:hypothetical protein
LSNWRELNNLVEFAKGKVHSKELEGCKILIFTENITVGAAFWKGLSKLRKLFDLVLRLQKLEMEHGMIIHDYPCCAHEWKADDHTGDR